MSQTVSVPTTLTALQEIYGDQFALAVNQAAATLARPEFGDRLQKAMDFVLSGAVTLNADGTATVKSGSHAYQVNGECPCADSQQRSKYCKHYLAANLLRRTLARLNQPANGATPSQAAPEASAATAASPQAPVVASLPEAPASANVFVMLDGHRVQITVRGHTLAGVLTEIRTVLKQFPAEAADKPPQAPQAPAAPVAEVLQSPPPAESWCAVHGAWMRWNDPKPGDTRPGWWSHKAPEGWCKGKPRQ